MNPDYRIACLRFMARGLECRFDGPLDAIAVSIRAKLDYASLRRSKRYGAIEGGCRAWLAMYKELTDAKRALDTRRQVQGLRPLVSGSEHRQGRGLDSKKTA